MKKSEFKNIIREQVSKILKENDPSYPELQTGDKVKIPSKINDPLKMNGQEGEVIFIDDNEGIAVVKFPNWKVGSYDLHVFEDGDTRVGNAINEAKFSTDEIQKSINNIVNGIKFLQYAIHDSNAEEDFKEFMEHSPYVLRGLNVSYKKLLGEASKEEVDNQKELNKELEKTADIKKKIDLELNESNSNNGELKKLVVDRLSQFFRVNPFNLSQFKFDGNDNMEEFSKAVNASSIEGAKLYYDVAIKSVKKELGLNENNKNKELQDLINKYKGKSYSSLSKPEQEEFNKIKTLKNSLNEKKEEEDVWDMDDEKEPPKSAIKKKDSVSTLVNKLQQTKKEMQSVLNLWKKAEGPEKSKYLNRLKELTNIKKELEKSL